MSAASVFPEMISIKEAAGRTGLPVHFIRECVRRGDVVAVQAGTKKFFVNADSLRAYLNGGLQSGSTK